MAEPDESAESAEAAPKKSKKKLFILSVALMLLLGGGGAAAWFFTQGSHSSREAEAEPAKAPVFLPLEAFTVNLQDGEQFLQTDITLQVPDQAQMDDIKLNMPRVRSRLLTLLSSKHADELATAEDKKKLAQEILAQVKQPFDPKGKPQRVDDVLFTSFVIQ
ncbi:MAG TPA: flagellar basal body-associated protein FliL [Thiobacillus sp.]